MLRVQTYGSHHDLGSRSEAEVQALLVLSSTQLEYTHAYLGDGGTNVSAWRRIPGAVELGPSTSAPW